MSVEQSPADAPSVTFLCTAYRTEDTIRETLDSVLRQTRADWELVVCDNGMSEAIAEIVEPYLQDRRVTMVRQENQFAWGGVNAAARHATGRYLAVLHTDDLVMPTFVERLVPLMDAAPRTGPGRTDALAPDAWFLGERGLRRTTFRHEVPQRYRDGGPVTYAQLIEGWVPYYTALVRREVWEELGGFRHDAGHVEDLGLWLDLIAHGHVLRCLEEPLTAYREDDDSDSRGARGVEVMEESWERVMTRVVEAHGSGADRAALAEALVRSRHRRATVRARRLLLDGEYAGAQQAAREARQLQPDARTRAMAAALGLSPAGVRHAYRARKSLERGLRRAVPRTPVAQVSDTPR